MSLQRGSSHSRRTQREWRLKKYTLGGYSILTERRGRRENENISINISHDPVTWHDTSSNATGKGNIPSFFYQKSHDPI